MKKTLCMVISAVVCVSALCSCGNSKKANIDEVGYDVNEVVIEINDTEITADMYRYFVSQAAISEISSRKPDFDGDFSTIDWDEKVDGDKTLSEVVRERAIDEIKANVIVANLGQKNGVSLTDEEKSQVDTMMEQVRTQYNDDTLKLALRQMGVSSEESFRKVFELTSLYSKVEDDFGKNRAKYVDESLEETLKQYKNDETITAQHILIMNDSEKHSEPKAVIDDVHKRATDGEDFNALMEEFNEDPGESEGGYTFGKGYMVAEFEQAAFALDYNQISDVVQSDYGYHVIKRIVGMAELREYLLDTAEIDLEDDLGDISIADVMNDVAKATEEINKVIGESNNG